MNKKNRPQDRASQNNKFPSDETEISSDIVIMEFLDEIYQLRRKYI